jgi:hypothetical protein
MRLIHWKNAYLLGILVLICPLLLSQETKPAKPYLVAGLRHGASYFPAVDYPETRPLRPGEMDFKHYHKYEEVVSFLRQWEKDYPDLVALYSVGKSFEGRDIWQITIANRKTGKDTDKPAMFLEGNRHSGEVTAAESALYFAWHVLTNYGKDPDITRLVDTKALYVRVKNNPDGSELYLNTAQGNRSSVRPHDSDGDGLLDEDPAEDLDGDGFCRQMRKKVEPGKGEFIIDPADASGRLMKRAGQGKGDYLLYSEGLDNDGDGKYNEDGIGGLDLHRNYPENWRPEPGRDLTGRGWTQLGAGEYPLSEPETRSVVLFLLEHPNVSVGQTMDTAVPMHLRPPSTSRSEESMFPEDLAFYSHFDAEGKKITGYPYAGDVYWDYAEAGRSFREMDMREPQEEGPGGRPLFGHSPDFGYSYYGAIWYGDELWSGGRVKDYDGDGRITELEVLRWNDEALGGRGFKNWTKFNHPQLGEVEIGGYNPKFFRQNPPPEFLEEWARKEAMFNLLLAKSLPQVRILSAEARPVKKKAGKKAGNLEKGKDLFELTCVVTNEGFLPTALKMAERVKIVRPDWVVVMLPEATELEPGFKAKIEIGYLKSGEKKEVRWRLKIKSVTEGSGAEAKAAPAAANKATPLEAEVSVFSTRGGVDKKKVPFTIQ